MTFAIRLSVEPAMTNVLRGSVSVATTRVAHPHLVHSSYNEPQKCYLVLI